MEYHDRRSAVQIQQEYYENLPDCDWVKYEKDNRNYLLQNVAFALFGSPSEEGELQRLANAHLEGYTSRQKEQVMKVYEKICEQCKYSENNEDIVMSILLIVCAKPEREIRFFEITPADYWWDLHSRTDTKLWYTAVFRIRKCIPTTEGAKCCRVYIDDNARVYQTWESYLTDNTQPKCVLTVPENGEYQGQLLEGKEFSVKLTVCPSPALGVKARVLSSADTVSTVASIGAIGVLGAVMVTPVAPVVLAGAVVATVATGAYGLIRSSIHLHDRSTHEQSISPSDPEARGSWLNITASTVGLAGGAASSLLSRSAAAGTNMTRTGRALALSVEVLRHANIVTGSAGLFNSLVGIVTKYHKYGERPTKLEVFQFTAATLFFCNAVMSNRTAQNIIEDAQANSINDYRATLRSNRHRRIFDKLSAETRRTQGSVQGNTEVINGIKSIANKDQFFADVLKINKDINRHGLRISMSADGQVNLNAQHRFNPSELYNVGQVERSQLFTSLGPSTTTGSNVPTRVLPSNTAVGRYVDNEDESQNHMLMIRPGEILRIGQFLIRLTSAGSEHIAKNLENLSKEVYDALMTIALNLLQKLVPEDVAKLKLLSPDQDLIEQIVAFVFSYLKERRPFGESQDSDNGIVIVLKDFFQNGVIRQDMILKLKARLTDSLKEKLETRRREHPNQTNLICSVCQGVRYA